VHLVEKQNWEKGHKLFRLRSLKYKDRCLGIMNIVFADEEVDGELFRLLDSIGFHIGLALENSELMRTETEGRTARSTIKQHH
jgi:hypothetical protein